MVLIIWCHCSEMKKRDNVTMHYRLDKGHERNIGTISQEYIHYIMWNGNSDPTRFMHEIIRQKQQ